MKKYIKIYVIFFKYWKLLFKMNHQTKCRLVTINSIIRPKSLKKILSFILISPPTPKSYLQPLQFKRMEWVIQNDPTILWIWRQELYIMVQVKIMLLGKNNLAFFFFFFNFLSTHIKLIKTFIGSYLSYHRYHFFFFSFLTINNLLFLISKLLSAFIWTRY